MNPSSNDLAILVPWVMSHGYLIFLIFAIIEGPLITIAAGIAAALGYFNVFIILGLAFLGDIVGDLMYYWIGYIGHNLTRSPFFRLFGLTEERILKIEKLLRIKTLQAVMLVKLSPVIGPIGLIVIGSARPPFKKFFWPAVIICIPKSFFYVLLGFYFGQAYVELNKILAHGQYVALGLGIFLIASYFVYIKFMGKVTKDME